MDVFAPAELHAVYHNQPGTGYTGPIFQRRTRNLDWNYVGNIDVTKIGATGDTASLDELIPHIAYANISERDMNEFNSRGALHGFMILQIAVEHLMRQNAYLQQTLSQQSPQLPHQSTKPDELAYYEGQVAMLKSDLRARDIIIDNLTHEIESLKSDRLTLAAQNETLRGQIRGTGKAPEPPVAYQKTMTESKQRKTRNNRKKRKHSSSTDDSDSWA